MEQYTKIQTVFKRDQGNNSKTLLIGQYSLPEFEYLKDLPWVFTEKVDGTNIRIKHTPGNTEFAGKTDNAQIPAVLVGKLRNIFDPLSAKLTEVFPEGVCLYGEGFGPKIQKGGGNYGAEQDFVLFDVKVGEWWLQRKDVEDVAEKLGLKVVPIIGEGTLDDMIQLVRNGITSKWGAFQAEGIVALPNVELRTRDNSRIITKLKTKDFAAADNSKKNRLVSYDVLAAFEFDQVGGVPNRVEVRDLKNGCIIIVLCGAEGLELQLIGMSTDQWGVWYEMNNFHCVAQEDGSRSFVYALQKALSVFSDCVTDGCQLLEPTKIIPTK